MLDPVPDARIADDIARSGAKRPAAWAQWVDRAVVVLLPAAGLLSPQGPRAFYAARGYREIDRFPDKEWNSGLITLLLAKTFDEK